MNAADLMSLFDNLKNGVNERTDELKDSQGKELKRAYRTISEVIRKYQSNDDKQIFDDYNACFVEIDGYNCNDTELMY